MSGAVDLKPRAVTALVTLRGGSTSTGRLCDVIVDNTIQQTRSLMDDLAKMGLVQSADREDRTVTRTWCLTQDGLGWLQNHGLEATDRAKKEIYEISDRKRVA